MKVGAAVTGYVLLDRHCNILDNFLEHLVRLLRLLQRRSIEIIDDDAVGEDWNHKWLEIFRRAERPAFQEGHRLSGAVEGLRSSGGNSQRQEF